MKNKRILAAVLAAAAASALSGCSVSDILWNDEYEYEYQEPAVTESQNTLTTDDADSVYDEIDYVPEMFFGKYVADGTTGNTISDPEGFVKGRSLNYTPIKAYEGEKIAYVPFRIEAGPRSNPTELNQVPGQNWMKMYILTANGEVREMEASYTLSGRMLLVRPVVSQNIDPETNQLEYSLTADPIAFRYSFTGTDLKLSHGTDEVILHAEDIYNGDGISITDSNLVPGSENINGITSFNLSGDSGAIIEGDDTYSAEVKFNENGFCDLKWGDKSSKLIYFYGGDDGLVFSDGSTNYLYTARSYDLYAPSISGNINNEEQLGNLTEEQISDIVNKSEELYSDLNNAFADAGINAQVNKDTGEISLNTVSMFSFSHSDISPEGRNDISRFMKAYTSVIFNDKYDGFISGICIEGHTDKSGSYNYNMDLSKSRASNVLDFCLSPESGLAPEIIEKLRPLLTSAGFSYDVPVLNEDGSVNDEASRRVAFRFTIDLDQ
ncbi:MAG TPA: hypothetical protein DCZ71_00120 [Ruminococcus sp.]|nr:hypothetical protein [Ruminococcus sp.]